MSFFRWLPSQTWSFWICPYIFIVLCYSYPSKSDLIHRFGVWTCLRSTVTLPLNKDSFWYTCYCSLSLLCFLFCFFLCQIGVPPIWIYFSVFKLIFQKYVFLLFSFLPFISRCYCFCGGTHSSQSPPSHVQIK